MKKDITRRKFLTITPLATAGLLFRGKSFAQSNLWANKPNSKFAGVQIGVTTYSYRSMPHDIDQLVRFCKDSNISAIELKGDPTEAYAGKPQIASDKKNPLTAEQIKQIADWRATASMDKFVEIREKFKKEGISIYAFKPDVFGAKNTDAEIEYGMKAAKALGATAVTLEMPTDAAQTKRLGDLAAKHKIYVGYHAHLQATDTLWDEALKQSPYNTLNIDCGHYIAAGGSNTKVSLLALLEAKHDRISSIHLKDRFSKENGGKNTEWGKGDTPIKEILSLMKTKKYKFPATIELEYDIPEGSNAVKEVAKCVEFGKNILVA